MIYEEIADHLRRGIPVVVVSVVEKHGESPVDVGKKMVVTPDGAFGTVGGGALEYEARELAKTMFNSRGSFTRTYLLDEGRVHDDTETLPMACGGKVTLFFEYIGPREYVYVFGAGHVGQALVKVLKTMSYHVTVIDERDAVAAEFEGADHVFVAPFADFIRDHGLKEDSFVIVCTPSHKHDYNVLHAVIEQGISLKYIGMLCSPKKLAEYLDKTKSELATDVNLKQFYAPVGLDLGGGSPAEIAVSIAAEMQLVSYQKTDLRHMRERNHDPYRYWED